MKLHRFTISALTGLALLAMPCTAAQVRLIATSPQIAELLFQLGLGGSLVGTTEFSDYPAEAKSVPRIGPPFSPGFEKVVALKPTLVLLDESTEGTSFVEALRTRKIPMFFLKLQGPEDLKKVVEDLQAKLPFELPLRLSTALASEAPKALPFTFLALTWADPPILFGRTSFLHGLLESHGGQGLLPQNWKMLFPRLSEEWVVRHRPDVLFYLRHTVEGDGQIQALAKRWWGTDAPSVIALDAEKFSRSTFTPLLALPQLLTQVRKEP